MRKNAGTIEYVCVCVCKRAHFYMFGILLFFNFDEGRIKSSRM